MARPAKLLRTLLSACLFVGGNMGCFKTVTPSKPGPDPDANSGPDAKRGGAKPMLVNRAETDSASWPKLSRTKWKLIEIQNPGTKNTLDCELHIDRTSADINIDLFNSLGTQVGFSPGPAPNQMKKLAVQIEELGTYFVRIQAAQPKDESDFSVFCAWDEQALTPDEPPRDITKPSHPSKRPLPSREQTFEEKTEKGTEGRITQSYREGDKTMFNLDKGTAAGVRVGTQGTILVGKSGRQPLTGGSFKVVKILDDGHSVAESSVESLGRSNRIVLFLD